MKLIPLLILLACCNVLQAAKPTAHEIVTLCLLGESRCQSDNDFEGMRAISQVILNRSRERQLSVVSIVMQPSQFSCMNDENAIFGRSVALTGESEAATNAASALALAILHNWDTYPDLEANHYLNRSLCSPSWAMGVEGVIIQDHTFIKLQP